MGNGQYPSTYQPQLGDKNPSSWDQGNAPGVSAGGQAGIPGQESGRMVAFPNDNFKMKRAELIRPYLLDRMKKSYSAYPMVLRVMSDGESGGQDRELEQASNMAKLMISSPEEFGTKYAGQLQQLATEHGIDPLVGYSFRTSKIELIGGDKVLLLDYDLNPMGTREIYEVQIQEEDVAPPEGEEKPIEDRESIDLQDEDEEIEADDLENEGEET
jgi:hypothetical protein